MFKPTDEELIDKLIAETEDDIPVIDANTLDGQTNHSGDGRFDALHLNSEATVVVSLGDGKTGFQNQFTLDGNGASLALVRFTSSHPKDDVTEEDHKTATKPFLRIDFDNERALDSVINVLNILKKRWTERKLAEFTADMFETELKKQIAGCPHDPTQTNGAIGMYHCPNCGEMVIAGVEHP